MKQHGEAEGDFLGIAVATLNVDLLVQVTSSEKAMEDIRTQVQRTLEQLGIQMSKAMGSNIMPQVL